MKDGCLTPEELALALGTPGNDPKRRHLEECEWCQGLAASLDLFQRDGGLPAGADIDDAEDHLGDFLQREIMGDDRPARVVPLTGTPRKTPRRWAGPAVWAAAAVLVVAVGLTTVLDRESEEAGIGILRGGEAGARDALRLHEVQVTPEGGLRLTWSSFEEATGYAVLLMDGEQREAGRVEAGRDTVLTLDRATLEGLASHPSPWFIRVEARGEDDILARSMPRIVPSPNGGSGIGR
jgi:hypothetical protein